MDGRTKLAMGGATTLVASIAVVCAVAVTNAAALADTAGAPLSRSSVHLPAASPPTPVITAQPVARTTTDPETVPVVDPTVITPVVPPAPAVPPPAPPAPVADQGESQVADAAVDSGRRNEALEWARNRAWSEADIQQWAAQLQARIDQRAERADRTPSQLPANAGSPSERDRWSHEGSKRDQSRIPPQWRD